MKSYGQACGLAKALDAVGDRWTLLIVRELLIRGGCRYTDLKDGLPGIASNLLVDRLKTLEESGLIRRQYAAPPVATDLFSLTERGEALQPALLLLGTWGAALLGDSAPEEAFHPHWIVLPLRAILATRDPPAASVSIAVKSDEEEIAIRAASSGISVKLGPVAGADAIVKGPARQILRLFSGTIGLKDAKLHGLDVAGDLAAIAALIPEPALV